MISPFLSNRKKLVYIYERIIPVSKLFKGNIKYSGNIRLANPMPST